ncbi:MAG: PadR family transcriptional regulator [Clostridiaceae bacterium]|nr:PadR family transcriptional regulator [Clostridiaceae bacterium]
MDPQLKKGLLDACVLAVIEDRDTYGYSLTQKTVELLGVSESSLYPVLRRLEQQGCFETYNAEYGGRLRKYYRMTPKGQERLSDMRADMNALHRIIEFIMGNDAKKDGITRLSDGGEAK